MYNFLSHLFLETGFPLHILLGGLIVLALVIYWEELR